MRSVSIFGATGSVGESTFDLLTRQGGALAYRTVALTGGRNIARLAEQAVALKAEIAVTAYDECHDDLRAALAGTGIETAAGAKALAEAGCRPADWVMSAIVGVAGLVPGFNALGQGATLALANKESLVAAGGLLLRTARDHNARILPVDSEHSAVFQSLLSEDMASIERIIITASGGAFRDWPVERLATASVAEASTHPNWDMGQRITIDSASMFNKALEVIETHEFFGIDPKKIEVLIHPESLVHAVVGFCDGGMIGHLGAPDMRHAIGYALNWPDRVHLPVARLDLGAVGQLSFSHPDLHRYPALRLAREVMDKGGLAGAVFNAAKEIALDAFIAGRIGFLAMTSVVEDTLEAFGNATPLGNRPTSLDMVLQADAEARRIARGIIDSDKRT
jgi:1-deoxy-D-xylulose-5-phosphate reductoisomerase